MSVFKPNGQNHYRIQFQLDNQTYVKSSRTTDRRVAERMEAVYSADAGRVFRVMAATCSGACRPGESG